MSFFGRAANLIKGSLKTLGRPSAEADAKARALEAERTALEGRRNAGGRDGAGRDAAERRAAEAELRALRGGAPGADGGREAPAPTREPPERDENGEIKRTL